MSHILVPMDGSEHAEVALEYALGHFPEETITALHVLETPKGYYSALADDMESAPPTESKRNEAEELLEDAKEQAKEAGVEIETKIVAGSPADEILSFAGDVDADEIVIGSRGISGVGRIVFGSVAEKVVRRSEIPVVVVH